MHKTKGVPQYNVLIVDGLRAVPNPLQQTNVRVTGCLGDVSAGGPELIVLVFPSYQHIRRKYISMHDSTYIL